MRPDDQELDEEIRGHMALSIKERIDRGEDPEAARLAAFHAFLAIIASCRATPCASSLPSENASGIPMPAPVPAQQTPLPTQSPSILSLPPLDLTPRESPSLF